MKIKFVQSDITEALKAHLVTQGINLTGKTVDIKFTMKKLGAGVEADVSIEAAPAVPDLTEASRPTLSVVTAVQPPVIKDGPIVAPAVVAAPAAAAPEQQAAAEPAVEAAPAGTEDDATAAPVAKTTSSLFG